jgi:hypothetical protein
MPTRPAKANRDAKVAANRIDGLRRHLRIVVLSPPPDGGTIISGAAQGTREQPEAL